MSTVFRLLLVCEVVDIVVRSYTVLERITPTLTLCVHKAIQQVVHNEQIQLAIGIWTI
jgi:hypothetical protein